MELELANKTWTHKKNSSCKFSQSPTKKCLNQIHISLWLVASPREGKVRHHCGNRKSKCQIATLYESYISLSSGNKMSFVYHVVKQWGYNYINEDDKSLSERTQRHLMLKPKSKLM